MLKHENPNITIINPDLWAVRFALIPLIPQISITHQEGTKAFEDFNAEPLTITAEGIMILNKDYKHYVLIGDAANRAMKLTNGQIRKALGMMERNPPNKPFTVVYRYVLMAEKERRKIKKGVKPDGNH